ncbi:peptide chain release factor N(5)-glutamine methyltransferase [Peptoniphilus catoniae]|uniref:peptide chain release factor N(5)-glutamine methyltransferase n=1 Tax=Peptoniphilus catoniae TaxID=1660341 RepID=UPI0010FD5B79|nr:peptide chain release factor N(5)-glutamine methyltransferase [Peptoniphilus catoniae]
MEIRDILKEGLIYLKDSEYTNPFFELRLILSRLFNKDISYLVAHDDTEVPKDLEKKYFEILKRRKNGEPLAYIFGECEFYGKKFLVNKNVLVPRKETEHSVDVLKLILKEKKIKNFLEIGSGTGIVSVILALQYEETNFLSVDISKDAIANTKKNIDLYNLNNIKVAESNVYSNVTGKYDIIYSNPPYIASEDIENLQIEVKQEPRLALDGGPDGLSVYKKIIKDVKRYLNPGGYLVLEIGYNQKEAIEKLLKDCNTLCIKDISGHDRVIVASEGEIDVRKFRCI